MDKKVKFIKDHVSGLGKGSVVKLKDTHADRLIEEKFVEEVDDKTSYKRVDSFVADPGKAKREKKKKEDLAKKKKALAVRESRYKQ